MGSVIRTSVLLIITLLLSACASERMRDLDQAPPAVTAPSSDKATVVFLRPSMLGGAIQSVVYDISDGSADLIGIVSAGRKTAYSSKPGERRFMVVSEAADFMAADLRPGKTYFARVEPRVGLWRARFSLKPVPSSNAELEAELNSCKWVDNTPASYQWAKDNMPSVQEKLSHYLAEWQLKADKDKPFLAPDAGR